MNWSLYSINLLEVKKTTTVQTKIMSTIPRSAFDHAMALALVLSDEYDTSEETLYEWFEEAGIRAKTASGCYRSAVVLKNAVLKVSHDRSRQNMLRKEAEFIAEMRRDRKFGRHFPVTHVVTVGDVTVLVQEKIDMNQSDRWHLEDDVERLADKLGIDDMHSENYGWKGKRGREYPVFVDVDARSGRNGTKRKIRSWMV